MRALDDDELDVDGTPTARATVATLRLRSGLDGIISCAFYNSGAVPDRSPSSVPLLVYGSLSIAFKASLTTVPVEPTFFKLPGDMSAALFLFALAFKLEEAVVDCVVPLLVHKTSYFSSSRLFLYTIAPTNFSSYSHSSHSRLSIFTCPQASPLGLCSLC